MTLKCFGIFFQEEVGRKAECEQGIQKRRRDRRVEQGEGDSS